jgi:hypothetical protein
VNSAGSSSEFDPPALVETCDEESQGESAEEINLQERPIINFSRNVLK